MNASYNEITANDAARILDAARFSGVPVEEYLESLAAESSPNGEAKTVPIRKSKTRSNVAASIEWLHLHGQEFTGKWVVLDGSRLIEAGDDPAALVERARESGVKIPFVKFIDTEEPFSGTWL